MSGKVSTHDLMTDETYTITTYDNVKDAVIEIRLPSGVSLTYRADYSLANRIRATLRPLEK